MPELDSPTLRVNGLVPGSLINIRHRNAETDTVSEWIEKVPRGDEQDRVSVVIQFYMKGQVALFIRKRRYKQLSVPVYVQGATEIYVNQDLDPLAPQQPQQDGMNVVERQYNSYLQYMYRANKQPMEFSRFSQITSPQVRESLAQGRFDFKDRSEPEPRSAGEGAEIATLRRQYMKAIEDRNAEKAIAIKNRLFALQGEYREQSYTTNKYSMNATTTEEQFDDDPYAPTAEELAEDFRENLDLLMKQKELMKQGKKKPVNNGVDKKKKRGIAL